MQSKKKDTEGPKPNMGIWRASLDDDFILFKSISENATEFDIKAIKKDKQFSEKFVDNFDGKIVRK